MQVIGRYKLVEKTVEVETTTVYKAIQVSLGRIVALRVLRTEFSSNREFVERFRKEAKIVAKLNHENIVQIYDVGEEDGVHYVATEYCEGESLDLMLKREGKLSPEKTKQIVIQIASALGYAHRQNVFQLAFRPQDIIVTLEGRVKLVDIGIARAVEGISSGGTMFGAPQYISPEQARGAKIDGRSDIYSLGIVMYEMLTGRVPFQSENPVELARLHVSEPASALRKWNERIPAEVEAIVLKCLEKKPEKRHQTAEELVNAWGKPIELAKVTRISQRRDTIMRRKQAIRRVSKKQITVLTISLFLVFLIFTVLSRGSSLNIESRPPDVSIYIDGKYCGEAPVSVGNLRRGKHLVLGKKKGFKDSRQEVMLRMGGLSLQLNLIRETGLARIFTIPEGAHVYLGDELKGRAPLLLKNLPSGDYRVKLMLDDYSTEERVLRIEGGVPVVLEVELKSLHGSVSIESVPEAAEIYVNGIYKGITPKTIYQLKPGRYELLLKKDGYCDFKRNVFLRKKQRFSLKAKLEEKLLSLLVHSEPDGADVFLNGELEGETPLTLGGLHSGEHKLKVEKEGYATVEKELTLDANQPRTLVSVRMREITGFLLVVCFPPRARVYVDGEGKGQVSDSLSIGNLVEGEHQLQVVKSGYRVAERRFKITAGKTTILNINLEETVRKWKPTVRLHLRTGGEIEGEIISRKDEKIVVRVKGGLITLNASEVESEERL